MAPTILMTGAKGFVGTYLRRALVERHPDAALILLSAVDDAPPGYVGVDILDCTALEDIVARTCPDVVIHLAAQASVSRTADDVGNAFAINLGGSLNLALAVARHAPEATVLFASTSEVYGRSFMTGAVTEASSPLPMNAYAQSKRLAEDTFDAVLPTSAKLIVARPFNHTGAGQREDFVLPSFAGQIARIEAGLQPPRIMVGNIEVRRDFLDVRDVVAAYVALLDAASALPSRFTCNIASGEARALREHVEILRDLSRVPFETVIDPARLRAADVPLAVGDASLLRETTGWAPKFALRDTLGDLLAAARAGLVGDR